MKRVVVIGGGFAGSTAAKKLETSFAVTLIDTKNYFEFTPGILRTVVDPTHIRKVQALHSHYLHKAKIVAEKVISVSAQAVQTEKNSYPFDYLVIASGSKYNTPIKEAGTVIAARAEHLRDHHLSLERANSILIVGGGLVGVELAAEIAEHYPRKSLTIIHAKDRLLERNPLKAIRYATTFLLRRGVTIRYQERVVGTKNGAFITNLGNAISADMTFLCTGITPNFEFMQSHFSEKLTQENYIKVNNYLQVADTRNIFAVGDINNCPVEKTAQNAERQAHTAVENILALEKGAPLAPYANTQTPLVISLGKWRGVFSYRSLVHTGLLPGILKSLIEIKEMLRYR